MHPTRITDRRTMILALCGLVLAFGLPELGLTRLIFADTTIGTRIGREIVWVGIATVMLLWVTLVERQPLGSIGLKRPTWGTLGWGVLATVALMATAMLGFAVIAPALGLEQNMAATGSIVQVSWTLMLVTAVVAGVTEEIVYRGYAIERLELLTGRPWLAGLIAGAAFLLVHASWGGTQLIVITFGTIIFVGLYLWRRDLPCVMLAHVLADAIGFSLARAQM